jgi:hypothetical protein
MARSAFFHRAAFGVPYACRSVLLAASAVSLALLSGCDSGTGKADKDISARLEAAQAASESKAPTATNGDLATASQSTEDSLPMQIHAKALFANSEMQLAEKSAAEVAANDALIDRLAGEIDALSGQIQRNNLLVDSLNQYDPSKGGTSGKSILDSLKETQSMVTGSDDKPDWIKTDAGALASLNAVDKKLAGYQADVAKLTDAIKTETDQRSQLIDSGDKLEQQSEHEHGDKSVELYTQASDARRKAAELTVQIDTDTAALARAQGDLALQQGQHDSLSATIKALDDKSRSTTDDWKNIQSEITAVNAASAALLGEDPVEAPSADKRKDLLTKPTIGSKAKAIEQLGKENEKVRESAETHFNKAIELYQAADNLAMQLNSELNTKATTADPNKSEQTAWTTEKQAVDPNTFKFLQADALLQKANFEAASAAEAKTRLDMINTAKAALTTAGLTAPPTMSEGDLAKQMKDAAGSAETGARGSFNKAITLLDKVSTGTAPVEMRTSAKVQEILAQYGWSNLETTTGDVQAAADHTRLAHDLIASATSESITLPPLPAQPTAPGATGTVSNPAGATTTAQAAVGLDPRSLIGTYSASQVIPGFNINVSFKAALLANGVLNVTVSAPDPTKPGTMKSSKLVGKWSYDSGSGRIKFTTDTTDGKPMPANDPEKVQTAIVTDGGKRLKPADGQGPDLVKE